MMTTNDARFERIFGRETDEDRRVKENPGVVAYGETWWREHYHWLQRSGYQLRPRYHPDWVSPWEGTHKDYNDFEEGQRILRYSLMDATQIHDNDSTYVMLKKISPPASGAVSEELDINEYLSSEPQAFDSRNPAAQRLEVLDVPDDKTLKILVMPLLRPFDDPPFETFGEAVAFFTQLFEGLKYLHDHRIAHRDCTRGNIMMGADKLYPKAWHPSAISRRRDWLGKAKHYTRTQRPVRYYFIDFGLSKRYQSADTPHLELPVHGGDKSAPEHQEKHYNTPCDPFCTDIYYVGNLIREQFLQKYRGFGFMERLVSDMVEDDPSKRPNIGQVVLRFETIREHLSAWKLHTRLAQCGESTIMGLCKLPFRLAYTSCSMVFLKPATFDVL
ncbi:hypothetical protein DENSPDRAFT_272897 [Dentipellis sp. KUC8613]|nr:hypothetical protein DENSPDRAFT_272897 [Dentipellis sp. KUC8613]